MPIQTDGTWDPLQKWPLIGLHAIVMDDGRVLTFGTDEKGMQGGQFIYDIYDPKTGQHQTLQNTTPTDIFCSAAMIIPGTNKILIAGGDARPLGSANKGVADVNILDMDTGELYPAPDGDMAFQRWYPTMVSLSDGRMVMLGGSDINGRGVATPEIYTYGEGWKTLTGAVDTDIGNSSGYPRAFLDGNGDIVYFATGKGGDSEVEVMKLNVDGNGSLSQIGTVPFSVAWDAPAVMYEAGQILVQDAQTGLWSMDINGNTPQFTKVGTLSQQRNWSNMTTLADGTVLINGGTSYGNTEAGADKTAVIWNPANNSLTYTVDEVNPRLYHSATVLLNDGTLLSLGGGSAGMAENNYLDGQVYRPPYLYDENGNLADRPVVSGAPSDVDAGDIFTINVGNAADIARLTFVQNGAATHALNMGTRFVELEYTVGPNNTLQVKMPELAEGITAGSWMLFAWDNKGVPSVAPTININPKFDGGGNLNSENLLDNGSFETAADVQDWEVHDYIFGWKSSNNNFELWEDGFLGVAATDGKTFIEIDSERGTISQAVELNDGQKYELAFDYAGRPDVAGSAAMEVLWNGQVVATINPTDSKSVNYTFDLIGVRGENILAFRSIA
ncbi:MAG: galactose oxidase-like domain-containing protein, partial [Salaquimonas sp.]